MRRPRAGSMIGTVASPTRHAMPAADAAWLHMDRPTNPMVVNSLSVLGGVPDHEAVVALLQERLVDRFPRFRQRIADPLGRRPAFEDDPSFEIEAHLHRRALPRPAIGQRWRSWSVTWSARRWTPTGRSGTPT